VKLTGWLAKPDRAGNAPGVLIAHEAMGMNDHMNSRTGLVAELGYAAFALDLYGATGLKLDEARERSGELMRTPGLLLRRSRAA
jgi:dienelactone hydrolase